MRTLHHKWALSEKCPITEFFLVRIFPHSDWCGEIRTRKNSVFGHFSCSDRDWKPLVLLTPRILKYYALFYYRCYHKIFRNFTYMSICSDLDYSYTEIMQDLKKALAKFNHKCLIVFTGPPKIDHWVTLAHLIKHC